MFQHYFFLVLARIRLINGWKVQFVSNRRKAPTEAENFGKNYGILSEWFRAANGIWLWVSFERCKKAWENALWRKSFWKRRRCRRWEWPRIKSDKKKFCSCFAICSPFFVTLLQMSSSTPFIINTFYFKLYKLTQKSRPNIKPCPAKKKLPTRFGIFSQGISCSTSFLGGGKGWVQSPPSDCRCDYAENRGGQPLNWRLHWLCSK